MVGLPSPDYVKPYTIRHSDATVISSARLPHAARPPHAACPGVGASASHTAQTKVDTFLLVGAWLEQPSLQKLKPPV